MMIRISYYPEAEDRADAEASDAEASYFAETIEDAHDSLLLVKRLIELQNKYTIPENAGSDTLQPDVDEDI